MNTVQRIAKNTAALFAAHKGIPEEERDKGQHTKERKGDDNPQGRETDEL